MEEKISQWTRILVLIATSWMTISEGVNPSVSLTVEGGVSLVGPHCPGTVRLFCVGVDLTILRWRYNDNIDLVTFFSDTTVPSVETITSNPAFLSAELTSVAQNVNDQDFSNFSSVLAVNVSELQAENVTNIVCGDPSNPKTEPVDIEIVQQRSPESPNITNVTANFLSGSLNSVIVTWEKLDDRDLNFCQEYTESLVYEVSLTGFSPIKINHTNCALVCEVSFTGFTEGAMEGYNLSLLASNRVGASEVVVYPVTIASQSQHYFMPNVFSESCRLTFECQVNRSVNDAVCSVQYTTNPSYLSLSESIVSSVNTPSVIEGLQSDTDYYLIFSYNIENLVITDRVSATTSTNPTFQDWNIALVALAIVTMIILLFLILLSLSIKGNCTPKTAFAVVSLLVVLLVSLSLVVTFFSVAGSQNDSCSTEGILNSLAVVSILVPLLGCVIAVIWVVIVYRQKARESPVSKPVSEVMENDLPCILNFLPRQFIPKKFFKEQVTTVRPIEETGHVRPVQETGNQKKSQSSLKAASGSSLKYRHTISAIDYTRAPKKNKKAESDNVAIITAQTNHIEQSIENAPATPGAGTAVESGTTQIKYFFNLGPFHFWRLSEPDRDERKDAEGTKEAVQLDVMEENAMKQTEQQPHLEPAPLVGEGKNPSDPGEGSEGEAAKVKEKSKYKYSFGPFKFGKLDEEFEEDSDEDKTKKDGDPAGSTAVGPQTVNKRNGSSSHSQAEIEKKFDATNAGGNFSAPQIDPVIASDTTQTAQTSKYLFNLGPIHLWKRSEPDRDERKDAEGTKEDVQLIIMEENTTKQTEQQPDLEPAPLVGGDKSSSDPTGSEEEAANTSEKPKYKYNFGPIKFVKIDSEEDCKAKGDRDPVGSTADTSQTDDKESNSSLNSVVMVEHPSTAVSDSVTSQGDPQTAESPKHLINIGPVHFWRLSEPDRDKSKNSEGTKEDVQLAAMEESTRKETGQQLDLEPAPLVGGDKNPSDSDKESEENAAKASEKPKYRHSYGPIKFGRIDSKEDCKTTTDRGPVSSTAGGPQTNDETSGPSLHSLAENEQLISSANESHFGTPV